MNTAVSKFRRVLSVEDSPDSTAAVIASMQDVGIQIDQVGTVDEAVDSAASNKYDLILLDARLPSKNRLDVEAGPNLMKDMKERMPRSLNLETPFLVLSSFVNELDFDDLLRLPGFLGVLNKASVTSESLEEILGVQLSLSGIEEHGEYVVEDLLVSTLNGRDEGYVRFEVPSWPGDEGVRVKISHLPDDVAQELAWGDEIFYVWARVNIAAESAESVRPRNFRLYVGDEAGERAFDEGERPTDD